MRWCQKDYLSHTVLRASQRSATKVEKSNVAVEGGFSKAALRIALPCELGFCLLLISHPAAHSSQILRTRSLHL